MFKKALWILALLAASNLATYFWSEARLREIRQDGDRRLEASARIARERQQEIDRLQGEVDRLEAWGHLVDFQEELRKLDFEIESLNYGNAIARLDALQTRIQDGSLGSLLAGSAPALQDDFEAVRSELKTMGGDAADRLRVLGRSAFEALSGFAAEQGKEPESELSSEESPVDTAPAPNSMVPVKELPEKAAEAEDPGTI